VGKTAGADPAAAYRPALPQGESSTGVHQSLAGLGDVCKRTGTLLLVDTVCSLGGVPFFFDKVGGLRGGGEGKGAQERGGLAGGAP
jgi:hypothetical protein